MKHVMRGPYTYLLALLSVVTFYSCDSKEGEKAGKVFRYNQAEGLTSLDPAFARNQANIWAITQMYNGLFEVDKYLHAVPALVDSWEVSEDGKTWTFKLKSGVFFQDNVCFANGQGREVTAKDFVYSFKRLIDPATSSTGAWIFSDKVLTDAKGAISDTAFKAVDDQTLKIYLRKSFPPFLMILTMPYTCVVPHEAVEKYGKDFGRNPVGTGPFILDKWEEGTGLVMRKNPDY
jgi:ABC-type oligopeptide transport system substrate-binding subunit